MKDLIARFRGFVTCFHSYSSAENSSFLRLHLSFRDLWIVAAASLLVFVALCLLYLNYAKYVIILQYGERIVL